VPPHSEEPGVKEEEIRSVEGTTTGADDYEALDAKWLAEVYQGDKVPQLTLRAVLIGGVLGSLMSISNLYTTLKLGWAFGVAVTACVLSYVFWKLIRLIFRNASDMSILETNCMQSTASAAGYSTGATVGTAFGAYLLITGHHLPPHIVVPWVFVTAMLGVFIAIPLKRQMINHEQLAFPSGIAAAETLKSLYGKTQESVRQAYALVTALVVGAITGLAGKGDYAWQKAIGFKLPELMPFNYSIPGATGALPGLGFEPGVLLIGAGMIIGMRVSLSMLLGSLLLYFIVAPAIIPTGDIEAPGKLLRWSLWTGTALMVTSGLTAFALQWKTIARAFQGLKGTKTKAAEGMAAVEVPMSWFLMGVIPIGIALVILQYVAFSIAIPLGFLSVLMSFALALVACRSTGETDITPIGPMGKITQFIYAVLAPSNMVTNLMVASVSANTSSASADLLTDLKSGYLLGANARKQFIAQFLGVFFGTVAIVPAWYLMVPNKEVLEAMNPPSTNMWKAVAEALSYGIQYVPVTARWGILIGAVIGIVLALIEHFVPKARKFTPSAMGLGLSWVVPFANGFAFFIGALIAWLWTKWRKDSAELYVVPVASGAIAGESLACAIIAIISAAGALH
jgi:putative OPT family oligopeptide transporter